MIRKDYRPRQLHLIRECGAEALELAEENRLDLADLQRKTWRDHGMRAAVLLFSFGLPFGLVRVFLWAFGR